MGTWWRESEHSLETEGDMPTPPLISRNDAFFNVEMYWRSLAAELPKPQ